MKKLILLVNLLLIPMTSALSQEPTVSETFSFIKLKTINKLWHTTNLNSYTYTGCEAGLEYNSGNFLSMDLTDKKIVLVGECNKEKTELIINLKLIQSIEVSNEKIILNSGTPFYQINFNSKFITPNNKFLIVIYFSKDTDDAERVKKAFTHLLKLLNIELIESKF